MEEKETIRGLKPKKDKDSFVDSSEKDSFEAYCNLENKIKQQTDRVINGAKNVWLLLPFLQTQEAVHEVWKFALVEFLQAVSVSDSINELIFFGDGLNDDIATLMKENLLNSQLESLQLLGGAFEIGKLSSDGLSDIATVLKGNNKIMSLALENLKIDDAGAAILATVLEPPSQLAILNLTGNHFSAKPIAEALRSNNELKTLKLGHYGRPCGISDDDAKELASMLKSNNTLRHLELYHSQMSFTGLQYFTEALSHNTEVQVICKYAEGVRSADRQRLRVEILKISSMDKKLSITQRFQF